MNLLALSLKAVATALVEPSYLIILIILSIMFYIKNRKISFMQKMTIGESIDSPLELTLSQIVIGILAGILGSILLTILGISFNANSGIELVFMTSLILLLIRPRFVCFSYSAAALGFTSIIVNFLSSELGKETFIIVNIVALMSFVGVLHIVEGFLVMLDGSRGAIPVFTKRDDKIIGGFSLKRYWPLPIAILLMENSESAIGNSIISIPNWWPVIQNREVLSAVIAATLVCVPYYAVIGFSTITFTKEKKGKAIDSGLNILIYGIFVVLISQLASYGLIGQILVLFIVPAAHEFMLKYGRKKEYKDDYLFTSDEEGISILEVAPSSPAFEVGIRRGDKILSINGKPVINESDILKAVKNNIQWIPIKIRKNAGNVVEYLVQPRNKRLGLLLVPKLIKSNDIANPSAEEFKKIFDEMKNKSGK